MMTAGALNQAAVTPPWNPNKPAAPGPPTTTQTPGPSALIGESSRPANVASGSSVGNAPDVTADIVDLYDPGSNPVEEVPARPITPVSVPPDYPLDSLPRGASAHSFNAHQSHHTDVRITQGGSRNVSNIQSNQRRGDPTISGVTNSSGEGVIPVSTVSHRVPSSLPLHVTAGSQHRQGAHTSVTHSNVSVNVNHSVQSSNRQIRTNDLNVGVSSRLDPNRPTGNVLPDLVTQAQLTSSSRQVSSPPRASHPVESRVSQSYRSPDAHHRSRHRDRRHSRARRHSHRHDHDTDEPCKESCMKCLAIGFSFRWILVVLSLLGVSCVVTGIVLAALHAAGNSFLFLAIMFIGLGVLLVVVVGVGWKCTPRGHEPLHVLFNLGDFRSRRGHRQRSRPRREGRWYGGVMYPEFQYRRPPPSYNASMHDYQPQMTTVASPNQPPDMYDPNDMPDEDYSLPSSPPPSYRSRASTVRGGIQITFPPNQGGDYPDSRPPTYRSHPSNTLQGHGRTRPSLSRDDENDDLPPEERAPEDVAFTGSSFIVDTNSNQNSTSIQIDPNLVTNQNVTVSVTTVSVTTQAAPSSSPISATVQETVNSPDVNIATTENPDYVDPVGDPDTDHIITQL